uniref:Putative transcriptional regulator n=1 Tax=Culex tarsalis TaxID=7177 RepID=A0A1Q3FEX9_CULTA
MAENSTIGAGTNTQPSNTTTASKTGVGGGGGLLHSNKSLDMTTSPAGGGGGGGGGGGKGSKHSNVIHRTTSESLRLGGAAAAAGGGDSSSGSGTPLASLMNSSSAASINSVSRKAASVAGGGGGKPSSSFMITSVTVGARTSADNGDDSADDLDESHTDDNSRITDFENETPSFSEDTFSKEDVFFAANALGSVPVIPTSSQYGLAIVAPSERGHGSEALADAMHVSVTDAGINIMGHSKEDGKDPHHRNERFKVVKIESTEPFKRGRWVCMDYLDHTTLQASPKEGGGTAEGGETSTTSTIVDSNAIRTQDSGVVLNDNSYGTTGPSDCDNADYHTHLAAGSAATNPVVGLLNNESPGQSLNLAQSTTSQQQQQQASHAQTAAAAAAATVPHSLPQTQLANALAGAQAPQPAAIPTQQAQPQYYPHTMSNLADITQQQPAGGGHQHGVTLPTNIQMQQPQQQPNNSNSSATVLPASAAAAPTSQEMNIVVSNAQQVSFPSPQQFQQQQPSQTSSPIVATGGDQDPAAVLSPSSSSVAAAPAPTPSQPIDSGPQSEPALVSASPATSSPITATAEPSAVPSANTSTAAVSSPSAAPSSSSHATIAAAAAAAAATAVTGDHLLSESNLLSAVAGVTAAAVAAAGGGDGEGDKTGEDGESLGRIQPVSDPTTNAATSPAPTTKTVPAAERSLTTSSLQQHLQQNIPLDRSRIPSSSASSVSSVHGNRNNTFTDLALGRTIQDLMRPGQQQPTSAAGGEVLCRTACNFLNNGAHSIATCTTPYPHRCVQDLIKEEMGGAAGGTRTPGTLSQAGSLVNIHVESELQQHAATGGTSGGFQSHPNSGRSSPAHTMFHHGGSPPKHLSAIGHSISIPSSTRVSRAPSPSFLHAAAAEHSSASGTSAVAIDNKIEQAMDLVKSHLMFAVREEVEVLKEKISELMDRINQLEYENNILKQNASQETLSQLTPSGTPSAAQSAQPSAGAAAASVAAALTPLAKSQAAAAAASAGSAAAAAAAGTPTVNPNANGSVS